VTPDNLSRSSLQASKQHGSRASAAIDNEGTGVFSHHVSERRIKEENLLCAVGADRQELVFEDVINAAENLTSQSIEERSKFMDFVVNPFGHMAAVADEEVAEANSPVARVGGVSKFDMRTRSGRRIVKPTRFVAISATVDNTLRRNFVSHESEGSARWV
jgi:hypothetical protein